MFNKTTTLRDGTVVLVRPARAGDARAIVEMHERLSADSVYYRYLRPYTPILEEIERICRLGDDEGAAYVATPRHDSNHVIGVAYYLIYPDRQPLTAEPAVLVEDQFQNRGLGRILLLRLGQEARAQGICMFETVVHPANRRITHIMQRIGVDHRPRFDHGVLEIRVQVGCERPEPAVAVAA